MDEYANGWAEIVKYGCWTEASRRCSKTCPKKTPSEYPDALTALIARCVEVKRDVVAVDEREGSTRALLNPGTPWVTRLSASRATASPTGALSVSVWRC